MAYLQPFLRIYAQLVVGQRLGAMERGVGKVGRHVVLDELVPEQDGLVVRGER